MKTVLSYSLLVIICRSMFCAFLVQITPRSVLQVADTDAETTY